MHQNEKPTIIKMNTFRFILFPVLVLGYLVLSCSCVPTPQENYVDNKSTSYEVIDVSANTELSVYEFTPHWETSFTNKSVSFDIDADVVVPDGFASTGSFITWVEPQLYNVETVQKIIDKYLPEYNIEGYVSASERKMTKSEISEKILANKEGLSLVESNPEEWFGSADYSDADVKAVITQIEANIDELEEALKNAPESNTDKLYSLQDALNSSLLFYIISENKTVGAILISSSTYNNGKSMRLSFSFPQGHKESKDGTSTVGFSEKEAIAESVELAETVGWTDFRVDVIEEGTDAMGDFYRVVLVKTYFGLPETYVDQFSFGDIWDDSRYEVEWQSEYIEVFYTADGITQFTWNAPTVISEEDVSSYRLCDFQKVLDRFSSFVQIQEGWYDDSSGIISKKIVISQIRLSSMKVMTTSGKYRVVPVWDFQGFAVDKYSEQQEGGVPLNENLEYTEPGLKTFVTIDALSGTVINRALGY